VYSSAFLLLCCRTQEFLQSIAYKEVPSHAECWYGTRNEFEMWAQNYVFALRECLKEMESEESDQYVIAEKLDCLTRDLVSDGTAYIILGTGFSLFLMLCAAILYNIPRPCRSFSSRCINACGLHGHSSASVARASAR